MRYKFIPAYFSDITRCAILRIEGILYEVISVKLNRPKAHTCYKKDCVLMNIKTHETKNHQFIGRLRFISTFDFEKPYRLFGVEVRRLDFQNF